MSTHSQCLTPTFASVTVGYTALLVSDVLVSIIWPTQALNLERRAGIQSASGQGHFAISYHMGTLMHILGTMVK